MINFIVAYDNQDANLGTFFEDCKNDFMSFLDTHKYLTKSCSEIPSRQCNTAYIDVVIPIMNSNPFVFIAFSHGNEKALCCGNDYYVEKDVNAHNFKNSLFYSTACLIGKELGNHLIEKECLAFIGYEKEVYKYVKAEKKEISKKCDNAGIIEFLSGNITIYDAYKRMKTHYTQQIDKLEDVKDMLFVADLRDARDALICLGNKNLKKEDLFVSK